MTAKPRIPEKPPAPKMRVVTTTDLGDFVCQLRRTLCIRQLDMAHRISVGRHWITALEQGKPTLELGLVFRALEALGLELELKPVEPLPPWLFRAKLEAAAHRDAIAMRRRSRRGTLREVRRLNRLDANRSRVVLDLD